MTTPKANGLVEFTIAFDFARCLTIRKCSGRVQSRPRRRAALLGAFHHCPCAWKDQAQVRQTWREQKRFTPTADRGRVAEHLARWDAAVRKA